jgi:hypothetical protein
VPLNFETLEIHVNATVVSVGGMRVIKHSLNKDEIDHADAFEKYALLLIQEHPYVTIWHPRGRTLKIAGVDSWSYAPHTVK